jgi:regulator of nucleoside diphosphate kinase
MPKKPVLHRLDYEQLGALLCDEIITSVASRRELTLLEQKVRSASVVDHLPHRRVALNSFVLIADSYSDELEEFQLVLPVHANIAAGKLSVLAPLGVAMLGQEAGESISVAIPSGCRVVRLSRVQSPESVNVGEQPRVQGC